MNRRHPRGLPGDMEATWHIELVKLGLALDTPTSRAFGMYSTPTVLVFLGAKSITACQTHNTLHMRTLYPHRVWDSRFYLLLMVIIAIPAHESCWDQANHTGSTGHNLHGPASTRGEERDVMPRSLAVPLVILQLR